MALSENRNWMARNLRAMINSIEQKIIREWNLNCIEIKLKGLEPKFDREVLKRIKESPTVGPKFNEFMKLVEEEYGKIFDEFSDEQKEIIVLKESKLSL